MPEHVGSSTEKPDTRVLVAVSDDTGILGGVVSCDDMAQSGSGGSATRVKNASGIRLLAVRNDVRRSGIGKALTRACFDIARQSGNRQVILHTTRAMQVA